MNPAEAEIAAHLNKIGENPLNKKVQKHRAEETLSIQFIKTRSVALASNHHTTSIIYNEVGNISTNDNACE